jgi:hypothetical protein
MPHVPDRTVPVGHDTTTAAHPRPTGLGMAILVLARFLLGLLFVLGILGVVVMTFGGSTVIEGLSAQTAEAVVLSVRQDTFCPSDVGLISPPCHPVYFPKVRFTIARGEQVDTEAADWSTDKSRINVGRSLKVYYDPLNPHHIQTSRWLKDDEWALIVSWVAPLLGVLLFFRPP